MEISNFYPLISYAVAVFTAQAVKPFIVWKKTGKFDIEIATASGGFPSSHSAAVAATTTAIALSQGLDSPLFVICLTFGIIACYDAANVRYYSGKNIQMTKTLVKDLKENTELNLDDQIYSEKMKDVLGHTYFQMISGAILGIVIAIIFYFVIYR